jgi:hypothetical protein
LAELEKPTMAELQEELNLQTPGDGIDERMKTAHDEQIPSPGDPLGSSLEKLTS